MTNQKTDEEARSNAEPKLSAQVRDPPTVLIVGAGPTGLTLARTALMTRTRGNAAPMADYVNGALIQNDQSLQHPSGDEGLLRKRVCRGAIVALALCGQAHAANPSHGEEIFKTTCAACHVAERDPSRADLATRTGPNLWGVIGRKAGIYKGYAYSYAMRTSGIIWTDQQLGRYIAAPQMTVPNVRMNFPGLKNPNDIQDVIAYLNTLR